MFIARAANNGQKLSETNNVANGILNKQGVQNVRSYMNYNQEMILNQGSFWSNGQFDFNRDSIKGFAKYLNSGE